MRKFIYIATTFLVCHIFGLGNTWLAFTSALFLIAGFKIHDSFLWEIPLAVLSCSVLQIAFADDIKIVVQILILATTIIMAYIAPKRLLPFFIISTIALFYESVYSIALLWAMLWYSVRCVFDHFITKKPSLQEYKF